jgi:phage repressor protein C with HTH and peptisase S24 domain
MSHNDIWLAVDRLAAHNDLSASGLAKKAGLDATTFNKSKRVLNDGRLRWPSTESIMQILHATNTNWSEFVQLMGDSALAAKTHELHFPFIHLNDAHADGLFSAKHMPLMERSDEVSFPSVAKDNSFVVEVNSSAYLPLYREGDKLLVSLDAALRRGDRMFVLPKSGEAVIAEFLRQTSKSLDLKPFNSHKEPYSLAHEDINFTARVMYVSQ